MEMNNDIFAPDLPIPEAVDFEDASMLAGRIICEVYKKTGGYDVNSFLFGKGCCE